MTVDPAGSGAPMSDRMQSLLSRAAEDQLAEQRQLAGALTELRAQLQQIAGDVASLRQGAAGEGSGETALASLSADIREAVRLLAERLDGVARLVQQRGSDLVELNAAVTSLQSAVRGQGEALGGIGSGLAALPSFGERIGGLQNNLGALHQQLAGIEQLSTAVGSLQQRVEGMDHGLRELKSAFAAIGARMAELPGRADLDAAAGRSAASLAGLTERLDGLDRAVAALPETLEGLMPDAPAEPAQDAGVDRLEARIHQLASTHRDSTAAAADRLAALEQQLDQVLAAVTQDDDADADAVASTDTGPDIDTVLTEIAEIREALVGEGGIVERLDERGDEDLDDKVADAVAHAVAASEERLTAHIDEAVLALADALLRRRTRVGVRPPMPATPTPAATPATPAPAPVEVPIEEPVADANDDEPKDSDNDAAPSWQTPPADQSAPQPEDGNRRRRPWWRPGD